MKRLASNCLGVAGRAAILVGALFLFTSYALAQVPSVASPPLQRQTYQADVISLAAPQTGAGDLACISGFAANATHSAGIVRVKSVELSGIKTTAQAALLELIVRSTADTGGTTVTAPTIVPLDRNNGAASATVTAWSAVPTPGTAVGPVEAWYQGFSAGTVASPQIVAWNFDPIQLQQEVVLRGATQSLCLNAPAAFTTDGPTLQVRIRWTEQ